MAANAPPVPIFPIAKPTTWLRCWDCWPPWNSGGGKKPTPRGGPCSPRPERPCFGNIWHHGPGCIWLPSRGAESAFYEGWASLLEDALARLDDEVESPNYLPAALRGAPGFADPRREGGAAFIASLLAPLRSGVILLRDDLERLGDEEGLACRVGERRYVLNAFLAQDPGRTLQWLASHAEAWSERVSGKGPAVIAAWWSKRAAGTSLVLKELAGEVQPGSTPGPLDPAPGEPASHSDRPSTATAR